MMVPRRISFYWSGVPMSWLRWLTLFSFRKHNPDWEMILYLGSIAPGRQHWTTWERQDFSEYNGIDHTSHLGEIDSLQVIPIHNDSGQPVCDRDDAGWSLLARQAGYFADMDILWTAPLDGLHECVKDRQGMLCFVDGYLSQGLLASNGQHYPWGEIAKQPVMQDYQGGGVQRFYRWLTTCPVRIPRIDYYMQTRQKHPTFDFYNMPQEVLYPWLSHEISSIWCLPHARVNNSTAGIHWYGGTRESQYFNNAIQPATIGTLPDSAIVHYTKQVIA